MARPKKEQGTEAEEAEGALHPEDMAPSQQKKEETTSTKGKASNVQIAREVLAGMWGRGNDRKRRLKEAGYDPEKIQAAVEKLHNQ